MAKKINNGKFGLRPNMMWLWTVIFIAILGFALFGQSPKEPIKTDWSEVDTLITRGLVSKVEVINRDNVLVTLTEQGVKQLSADEHS